MALEKNVISFSVFGTNPKYTVGLIRNLQLARVYYPDWFIFIFTDLTPGKDILTRCMEFPRVSIFDMRTMRLPGMFWRFLAPAVDDEVIRVIVRDTDSRPNQREVDAVSDWMNEGTTLHIMRDHPHHNSKIMGGMWGFKISTHFSLIEALEKYPVPQDRDVRYVDQYFLTEMVYNNCVSNSTVHASFNRFERHAKDFPSRRNYDYFVGEIFEYDDSRPHLQRDAELLTSGQAG